MRLFGGLERLLERLREGLDAMELTAQLAVAPVARAALWRARGNGARLEAVPLEVTGFDCGGFFRNIGISTVGELLKLPRDGRRRFEGRLVGVEDGRIILDVEGQRQHLEFDEIDRARLVPDV